MCTGDRRETMSHGGGTAQRTAVIRRRVLSTGEFLDASAAVCGAPVTRSAVVVAGLQDHNVVAVDQVDEPVLLADASRPASSEGVAQGFGFTDAFEWVAQDVVDQPIDALEDRAVSREPVGDTLSGWGAARTPRSGPV